jgi:hypothetical protein
MHYSLIVLFGEGAVLLVDIQVVIFMEVIAYIQIRPPVQVYVSYGYA